MELREIYSAPLSCFARYLSFYGVRVDLDTLHSIAPFNKAGATEDGLVKIARRLGIFISSTDMGAETIFPVLALIGPGFGYLILGKKRNSFYCNVPGILDPVVYSVDSGAIVNANAFYSLTHRDITPRLWNTNRQSRFHLVEPNIRTVLYDDEASFRLYEKLVKYSYKQRNVTAFADLSILTMRSAHRKICPELPEYYGAFRTVNTKRDSIFADWTEITVLLEKLVFRCDSYHYYTPADLVLFTIKLYVDFLSIHPFVNGNRRVGIELINCFLARHNCTFRWESIGRAEHYYWVRCASRGHFKKLVSVIVSSGLLHQFNS